MNDTRMSEASNAERQNANERTEHGEAVDSLARGIVCVEQGGSEAAIAEFSDSIIRSPRFAKAYFNRGVTYARLQNYKLAISDFSEAILIEPTDVVAFRCRARAYRAMGVEDKAQADSQRAAHLATVGYEGPPPPAALPIPVRTPTLAARSISGLIPPAPTSTREDGSQLTWWRSLFYIGVAFASFSRLSQTLGCSKARPQNTVETVESPRDNRVFRSKISPDGSIGKQDAAP